MKNIAVYILAGGKSSRMGTDKGLMLLDNKPMIQYIIDTVTQLTDTISIISNNKDYESLGFPVYPDLIKDKGPVGGIYTALSNSITQNNLILSCDTPFVSLELLQKLIDNCASVDICMPSYKGRVHPLIGVYKKDNTAVYKSSLDANVLKLRHVNKNLKTLIIEMEGEFEEREFLNLNTKSEFVKCF